MINFKRDYIEFKSRQRVQLVISEVLSIYIYLYKYKNIYNAMKQ